MAQTIQSKLIRERLEEMAKERDALCNLLSEPERSRLIYLVREKSILEQELRECEARATRDNNPTISKVLYNRLNELGMIPNDVREMNVGESDYSEHLIQPWAIWLDYDLNPWDADIVKRVLRHKKGESRRVAYEKIIHICKECIRQIDCEE